MQRKAGLNFLNNANLKVLTEVALPRYLEENIKTLERETFVDLQDVLHGKLIPLVGGFLPLLSREPTVETNS